MFKKQFQFLLPLLLSVLFTIPALAQSVPNTQVFVFHLNKSQTGKYFLEDPRWVSSFNPGGYNNQPAFINGWWYLSVRLPEESQNEIVALDLPNRQLRWMTDTPESEYSPCPIPGSPGHRFSVVRVEADSSQLIWKYQLEEEPQMLTILEEEKMVGYTKWLNDNSLALYLVNDPASLVVADITSKKTDFITSRIGRCMQTNEIGDLFFAQRITQEAPWQLKKYANNAFRPEFIITSPGNNEDFLLLKDGSILMGSESVLYRYLPGVSTSWEFVADLGLYGAKKITRLAINDYDELAIVFQK